jgi:hypothetical protein
MMKNIFILLLLKVFISKAQFAASDLSNKLQGNFILNQEFEIFLNTVIEKNCIEKKDTLEVTKIIEVFNKNTTKVTDLDEQFRNAYIKIIRSFPNSNISKRCLNNIIDIINDTTRLQYIRNTYSSIFYKIALSEFNAELKIKLIKNISIKKVCNEDVILLIGVLNMKNAVSDLKTIIDKKWESANSAFLVLCRLGDKKYIDQFALKLKAEKSLKITLDKYWTDIEYIKQQVCVDFLIKVLNSNETALSSKETLPPQKIGYSAIVMFEQILIDFPNFPSETKLEDTKKWINKNKGKIKINRSIW